MYHICICIICIICIISLYEYRARDAEARNHRIHLIEIHEQNLHTNLGFRVWGLRLTQCHTPMPRKQLECSSCSCGWEERELFIDNLLVRIHLIIKMILVDRPCAMGV